MQPPPSIVDFTQVLASIVKMKHYGTLVRSLSQQLELLGLPPNVYSLSIVINCYCHCRFFILCVEKNSKTWVSTELCDLQHLN